MGGRGKVIGVVGAVVVLAVLVIAGIATRDRTGHGALVVEAPKGLGQGTFVGEQEGYWGEKQYTYRFSQPDGKEVTMSFPRRLGEVYDEQKNLAEMQKLQSAGKGELVGLWRAGGRKLYTYRYVLSDGCTGTLMRTDPCLGDEEAMFDEAERRALAGEGEKLAGPGAVLVRVTLSDGRQIIYSSDEPLPR